MFFLKNKSGESKLVDQESFYDNFVKDLKNSKNEVIIESPFITSARMDFFYPFFEELLLRNVQIYIMTRDPVEHEDEYMRNQSTYQILQAVDMGIKVKLIEGYHHRKLAIIDRQVLWEGSLNILSYSHSKEVMRRFHDVNHAKQMISFLNLVKYL